MTQAQEAQAEEIDREQDYAVQGEGLVYQCNDRLRVRKEICINLFLNPRASNLFGSFRADAWPLHSDGFAHICKVNVDVEIPQDLDPLQEAVKALTAKKEEIQAEFTDKLMQVERAMHELLALPAPESSKPETPPKPAPVFDDDIPF